MSDTEGPGPAPDAVEHIEDWLRALAAKASLSKAPRAVIQAVIADPAFASYASLSSLSERAGVDNATVTRAAQGLGYDGWPTMRADVRTRFLMTLSSSDIISVRRAHREDRPFDGALARQIEELVGASQSIDRRSVSDIVKAISLANRRVVTACGSHAMVARALNHQINLSGYRSDFIDDAATLANAISTLKAKDVVVAITFWRLYKLTLLAARQAKARGATVCIISDAPAALLRDVGDHLLIVPTDGTSFFPSLVASLAVVEGLSAELAALHPEQTQRAITRAEAEWDAFDLLQLNPRARTS